MKGQVGAGSSRVGVSQKGTKGGGGGCSEVVVSV